MPTTFAVVIDQLRNGPDRASNPVSRTPKPYSRSKTEKNNKNRAKIPEHWRNVRNHSNIFLLRHAPGASLSYPAFRSLLSISSIRICACSRWSYNSSQSVYRYLNFSKNGIPFLKCAMYPSFGSNGNSGFPVITL